MIFLWLNIASGLMIALIFLFIIVFDRKNVKLELQNIKLIVIAAILVAIAIVLNTTLKVLLKAVVPSSILEVKIGNFALVLIGFFCGGVLGVLSGIAADFLGLLLYSTSMPVLFFTLTSIVWCILPYYLVRILSKFYYSKFTIYLYLLLTYAVTLLLISGISPIVLKYMYNLKNGWWVFYLPRIIKYPFELGINASLLILIYRFLIKSVNLSSRIYQPKNKQLEKMNGQVADESSTKD